MQLLVFIVCLGLGLSLGHGLRRRPSFAPRAVHHVTLHMSEVDTGVPDAQRNLVASHAIFSSSKGVLFCSKCGQIGHFSPSCAPAAAELAAALAVSMGAHKLERDKLAAAQAVSMGAHKIEWNTLAAHKIEWNTLAAQIHANKIERDKMAAAYRYARNENLTNISIAFLGFLSAIFVTHQGPSWADATFKSLLVKLGPAYQAAGLVMQGLNSVKIGLGACAAYFLLRAAAKALENLAQRRSWLAVAEWLRKLGFGRT